MLGYGKTVEFLVAECTADIRWEFNQLRSRIRTDEIVRLADGLLERAPLEWPAALLELQKGYMPDRLLTQLNFRVCQYGLASDCKIRFQGPFPAFSLKPLKDVVSEHRVTLRTAQCIEFIGNKAWNCALKPIKKNVFPFKINVATLVLGAFDCSPKQQLAIARQDLVQRIKGIIINFLHDWEKMLLESVKAQLLAANSSISISAQAV